jgi:sugar phosphate isomerase/epimerase
LCAGAWGFREIAISPYLSACAKLGFQFAEMNLTDAAGTQHLSSEPSKSDLDAMALAERAAGVKVVCFCAGNDFTGNIKAVKKDVASINTYVDMAVDYGVEVIRVFAGWTPFEALRTEHYQRCAAALAEVGAYAQDQNVLIALENHGGATATGAQVRRLIQLAGYPSVRANFDGGNFAMCKEDPLSAYLVLKDLIGYTHWKDVRLAGEELEYCALGDGITDWTPLVQALLTDGYNGYWTMEYEEPADVEEGMQKCIDVITNAANSQT